MTETKLLWKKTEHNYMYDPNAIQYYQTLFDNAVKILKTQLLLRLHYTQHYILKTSKKNNTNSNQMYIKKNILNSANYSSII